MLYKIGDFSKKTGLSIRTLRYYNSIDLLIPAEIDLFTGYRYYSDKQLEKVKIINELKAVGFSLEEIKENWDNFNDSLMIKKRNQLLSNIDIINEQIRKIDYLRSNIESGKIINEKRNKEDRKIKTIF